MTKLTGLDLYVITDTLLHSLAFREYWTGSATEEAREGVLKKLQMTMSEMEVGISMEDSNA
jgi:hypothetical protein